jgi:rhodanese-related sulfurtransferase
MRCVALAAIGFISIAVFAFVVGRSAIANAPGAPLAVLEADIAKKYGGVGEITVPELHARFSTRNGDAVGALSPILLDAREAEEYVVSHIPGAIRIDPDASAEDVTRVLAGRIEGRKIVVYCSVGVRSSRLIQRLDGPLFAAGARKIVNLRGGIFRWHNSNLPLTNASGPADHVHPFSNYWSRYLERREKASYRPV